MLYYEYMKNNLENFPKGFLWGAATSAYQIEGGLINDWSEWEKSPRRLADLEALGLNPTDYQSGLASNSWDNFEADISCLKQINASAYRFSIEWSRVEPKEGKFDEEAIAKYRHFIQRLKEEGIEPFVTLWHWPVPLWIHDLGKWTNSKTIVYFERYAEKLVQAFPEVTFWLTLNEPNIYAGNSYVRGKWPPQKKNIFLYFKVLKNLTRTHIAAYQAIKKHKPDARVGVVTNNMDFQGKGFFDHLIARGACWWWNRWFLNCIKNYQDIIGVNFYFRNLFIKGKRKNPNEKMSDMGWELYPWGIEAVLKELQRYNKPIYITENGLADEHDVYRTWYIQEVLGSVMKAIQKGADVRGYFYWSLIDNFEWSDGFKPKFGLFSVDRNIWKRTARPSAAVYAEIIKNNTK